MHLVVKNHEIKDHKSSRARVLKEPLPLLYTRGTRLRIKDWTLAEWFVLCFIKHIDINWGCWPAGSSGCSVQGWIGTMHCSASPPGRRRSSWRPGTGYSLCQRETYLQPWPSGGALRSSGHWSALLSWSRTGQTLQSHTLSSAKQSTVWVKCYQVFHIYFFEISK